MSHFQIYCLRLLISKHYFLVSIKHVKFSKKKFDENFKISDYLIFSLKNIIIINLKKLFLTETYISSVKFIYYSTEENNFLNETFNLNFRYNI